MMALLMLLPMRKINREISILIMKKYLYMIAALFGIDYFCKENIEAQKPEDFPRDMEKSHGKIRLYRNHNDGFCFGVKKEKKDLQNEVSLLNDDDYVTRYARENYVFTKDGEQVVILPDIDQEK